MRKSTLSIALAATLALVGCGGGASAASTTSTASTTSAGSVASVAETSSPTSATSATTATTTTESATELTPEAEAELKRIYQEANDQMFDIVMTFDERASELDDAEPFASAEDAQAAFDDMAAEIKAIALTASAEAKAVDAPEYDIMKCVDDITYQASADKVLMQSYLDSWLESHE